MPRKDSRKSDAPPTPQSSDGKSARERIVDAFMALLAQKPVEQIGYAAIAKEAGVSLPELRDTFGSTFAILAAHIKQIDRKVLADIDDEMAGEPPRERLFDTLMHRLELLEPYKLAVRSLQRKAT